MTGIPLRSVWSQRFFTILATLLLVVAVGLYISSRAEAKSSASRSGMHVLTIYDGGRELGILTEASTLRDALEQADFRLAENDITEPGLDEELVAATYEVNVYRARPVAIHDENNRSKVMTPYSTPKQIAKQAGITLHEEDEVRIVHSTELLSDGAMEKMVIERATPFTLVLYGKKIPSFTMSETVGDMLEDKDIDIEARDSLSVKPETAIKAGMTVEIWRNGKQTVTEEQTIKKPVREVQDADREAGYRHVKTEGRDGKRNVTYEIVMKNGKETSRKEISSVVTTKPVEEVVVVGIKGLYTGGPLSDKQLTALGMCESGMTATRNSGNGFYGAFQFMPATWQTVAPAPYNGVMPHEAPLDAQKQAVQNLLSRSSIYTQFPGCARKMSAQGII